MPSKITWSSATFAVGCMGVLLVVGHAFTIKSSKSFSNEGSSEKTSAAEQLKTLGQAQHGAAAAEARKSFSPKPFKVRAVRYSSSGEHKWSSSKKLIHFVRHGQGFHNLVGELAHGLGQEFDETGEYHAAMASHSPYLLPALRDPPLTALGLEDAKRLRPLAAKLTPQLLVVSPLRRATETILVGFDAAIQEAHGIHRSGDSPIVHTPTVLPIVATELCREQIGVHVCDQRFPVKGLQAEFPMVDYSQVVNQNEDELWQATRRETYPEMAYRAYAFLEWLRARPETNIVVGTHSAFLMCLYNVVLDCGTDEELKTFFATGEMRSTVLTWEAQN